MNEMQTLLIRLVQEGHPLAAISKKAEIPVGRLMRCKNHGQDLKHKDACKLQGYAESVKIRASDEVAS